MEALIGLAAGAGGLYSLVSAVSGNAADVTSAIPLAVLGLGVGALLVYVARGLWQMRDWARTPVFVTQIFLGVVAYYMFTSGQYVLGAVMAAVAVAAAAAVLSPPTTAALFPHDPEG
ncbi:membrane protein [Nocardiopsis sp. NRRL B-16309]|nr:membrane protein [Nocardiopsis sp. NRRL B-16309]